MRRRKAMHFSHHHPLHESKVQEEDRVVCSGCELDLSGPAYKCKEILCNFFLHKACFELPQEIQHKSHPAHPLTLLSSPADDAYEFTCDACGDSGNAFTYHCSTCDYGLHVKCASLPEIVSREDHKHPISLCYSLLYDEEDTEIVCDVCDLSIREGCWVYSCSDCDFGTHLDCATTKNEEAEEEEKEEKEKEESGSTDAMAPMHSLLAAQIQAQTQMQRLQLQMQTSHHQAQLIHNIGRSMVNLV